MIERFYEYWFKPIMSTFEKVLSIIHSINYTRRLVLTALLCSIATILQSMGGIFPGPGYLLSPLATAPILLSTLLSWKSGLSAYVVTIALLGIFQPGELFVFPFTTGILGICLGWSMLRFQRRIVIITISAIGFTIGFVFALNVLKFPLVGPVASTTFEMHVTIVAFIFSFLYSWVWFEVATFYLKKFDRK